MKEYVYKVEYKPYFEKNRYWMAMVLWADSKAEGQIEFDEYVESNYPNTYKYLTY